MTYDQADRILRGQVPQDPGTTPPPPLTAGSPVDPALIHSLNDALTILTRLARHLRSVREELGGAVDLSSGDLGTELKFTLVDGKPVRVTPKTDKEIHHTIAELMIFANSYVASKIYEGFPDSALLRIHRSVDEERFSDLREMLEAAGVSFEGKSNKELADTLKSTRGAGRSNSIVNALFQSLATRAMSEAQYICTGDREAGVDLSHYGLGLDTYTHFTSPIRRYADIVVHKQLLAILCSVKTPTTIKSPPSFSATTTPLPKSEVVSIMTGEGLIHTDKDFDDMDALLDSLVEGAEDVLLNDNIIRSERAECVTLSSGASDVEDVSLYPYGKSEVSKICEHLNLHNRLAKHSSTECQRLFLSLYFRDNEETTEVIVVGLRSNGFWGFVPRFDLRIPVYLADSSGDVQIDPGFLGLPTGAGLEPTLGFAASSSTRRFPRGRCDLLEAPDERLEVSVDGASKIFKIRPLDVLNVSLTCANWDALARIPFPRAQLVYLGKTSSGTGKRQDAPSSDSLKVPTAQLSEKKSPSPANSSTLFDVLAFVRGQVSPAIEPASLARIRRNRTTDYNSIPIPGRLVVGSFVNPDTQSAIQKAAQDKVAAETARRRANALDRVARNSEYQVSTSIEKSTTSRQQRLAASKRNAKRGKGS